MLQTDVHHYLKKFFTENDSPILEESAGHLHIQLSVDMDKGLMNRPFYWQYLEKIGGVPNPMKLTLITDESKAPADLKGERVHFGSPRLHQVFNFAKELGSHVKMYEKIDQKTNHTQSLPLRPWLNMNLKISYEAEKKKDRFLSIGLSLINGEMIQSFTECVTKFPLELKIPDYCFTVSPLIKPERGIARIQDHIKSEVMLEEHGWAEEAKTKMEKDIALLETFYGGNDEKPESYAIEKSAIQRQYEPKIRISVINGGLFYLHHHPLTLSK
ncbi:YqhG family protein [Alteribacter populi]|uniref:YqhG family protein n=1 Tax=Alteribacter populi TaxID=2011011 RepID=UPI000BBB35C4|nr:YqhG family protein [Alteribacter populi]